MNCLTVCQELDDILALTLPRNRCHFDRFLVVTSPGDQDTQKVVDQQPMEKRPEVHLTNVFWRHGADLNKGAAIEEGFDQLGRKGWICVLDCDVVLPWSAGFQMDQLEPGCLYTAKRVVVADPAQWPEMLQVGSWDGSPEYPDAEAAGYLQAFHASDPVLQQKPWYGLTWRHCGGCDSDFQAKWPADRRIVLPFKVLHLGRPCENWHGRVSPRLDEQPLDPELVAQRKANHQQMWKDRKKWGYEKEHVYPPVTFPKNKIQYKRIHVPRGCKIY